MLGASGSVGANLPQTATWLPPVQLKIYVDTFGTLQNQSFLGGKNVENIVQLYCLKAYIYDKCKLSISIVTAGRFVVLGQTGS